MIEISIIKLYLFSHLLCSLLECLSVTLCIRLCSVFPYLPLPLAPLGVSHREIFRDVIMQSAFHNLNIYTPWLHLSSQSTNTNKSIKTGYQPCLLCHLTAKLCRGGETLPLHLPVSNNRRQTWGCRRRTTFESVLSCALTKHTHTCTKITYVAWLQLRTHTHTHTRRNKDTMVLPLIASVPSCHSQRATNTNQISTSRRCVPCLRYSN